jgi:hypothetical protein
MSLCRPLELLRLAGLGVLVNWTGVALAQAICTSEGEPGPSAIVERFMPDGCEPCWRAAAPPTPKGALVADWVVPSGDSAAPLAAAALDESIQRLRSLGAEPPSASRPYEERRVVSRPAAGQLRLAHGPVVDDYLGVSVRWKPAAGAPRPLDAWVLMVEDIPAGVAGSVSARVLVRAAWSADGIAADRPGWNDRRAMHVPPGADPARLRLIGWFTDPNGKVAVAAATRCQP